MRYYGWDNTKTEDFSTLIGKTLKLVEPISGEEGLKFETTDNEEFIMIHDQDCCESVSIEDITGDLKDLVGSPITMAEESTSSDDIIEEDREYGSATWTFYKLATVKGYVTIRWYGSSNGYYSETADFKKVVKK